jgi:hypothetical protein
VNGALHYPGNRLPRLSLVANTIVFLIVRHAILGSGAIILGGSGLICPRFLHALIRRVFGQRFDHAALAYKAMPAGVERVLQLVA